MDESAFRQLSEAYGPMVVSPTNEKSGPERAAEHTTSGEVS
jgi:hypothetical protein